MDSKKYIGMDVHQATISVAVMNEAGKVVMDSVIETKARTILEFIQGLHGTLWITFEEGTSAAWLYDLLKPYVAKVVVCDPRKNALLKAGNKNDRIDARKLADLLRAGLLSPVYHGESGVRLLKELARSYLAITKDLTRVQNRIKGLYRSWAVPCAGQKVYSPRHRTAWLKQLPESGVQRRAAHLYQQLDDLRPLRREARQELLVESRKHPASALLRQIPWLGPIRVALLIALVQTPHRFRTKRQLWAYSGLALRSRVSGEYRSADGQLQRAKRQPALRGLNENHNHELKALFKSTATRASTAAGPFGEFYAALLATGMRPTMARLPVARKIAAIVLTIGKKGERFDPEQWKRQAAGALRRANGPSRRSFRNRGPSPVLGSARVRGRVSTKLLGGKGCLRAPAVSVSIICPLGQPKKAIGLESPIESWLAHSPVACWRFPVRLRSGFLFPPRK